MKFTFGDIVIVDKDNLGVVVKCWNNSKVGMTYEVYVRNYNSINIYEEADIERYMVRHKELNDEEKEYQFNAINNY